MSDSKPKLIVGRVVDLDRGKKVVEPFVDPHAVQVLEHQRRVAALIAAAYLYQEHPTAENVVLLCRAASDL